MTPQDVANAKRDRMSKKRFAFPYGETWINNKANSEQTSTPYKFTAKEYDEETGLYYYGARYYDAKLSRWVSADDRFDGLYSSQGQDVFAYVHGRPVMMIDPDGRATVSRHRETGYYLYGYDTKALNTTKAFYGFVPIPALDDIIYDWVIKSTVYFSSDKFDDFTHFSTDSTIKQIINAAGKGGDVLSVLKHKALIEKLNKIGKAGGVIDLAVTLNNIYDEASKNDDYFKAQFIIYDNSLLVNKDKDFIINIAPYIELEVMSLLSQII